MSTASLPRSPAESTVENLVIRNPDRGVGTRRIRLSPSLVRLGVGGRLAGAGFLVALVWILTLSVTG